MKSFLSKAASFYLNSYYIPFAISAVSFLMGRFCHSETSMKYISIFFLSSWLGVLFAAIWNYAMNRGGKGTTNIILFVILFMVSSLNLISQPAPKWNAPEGHQMLGSLRRAQLTYQEIESKGLDKWLPIRPNNRQDLYKLGMSLPGPDSFFVYSCTADACTAYASRSWKKGNYKDYIKIKSDGAWECSGVFKPVSKDINGLADERGCTAGEYYGR